MIHVRNLTKQYNELSSGGFLALKGISFDAMPGQIFGLLGPNGAGKTTALRILSTVLKPTSGTAIVNGFEVTKDPDQVRRQIGFVSTNTAIYDRMTAWEMVQFYGALYQMDPEKLQIRMESLFSKFQMNDIRNMLCSKMSTGMNRKFPSHVRLSTTHPFWFLTKQHPASIFSWLAKFSTQSNNLPTTGNASSSRHILCPKSVAFVIVSRL